MSHLIHYSRYLSPFRQEAEPSFKINVAGNVWYDFGLGAGGNVIDFAMQYFRVSSVSDALHELESAFGGQLSALPLAPAVPKAKPEPQDNIIIQKIKPITRSSPLAEYLQSRGVDLTVAQKYVQAVYYSRDGSRYFSLGFQNRSGGYEFRNKHYQGSHGRKDITIITPSLVKESGSVAVFEGFMDFLSMLVIKRQAEPTMPVIVLNTVAMQNRAIETIKGMPFKTVYLYPDHDTGGRNLIAKFEQECEGLTLIDRSSLYAGYKDVNDWLMQRQLERR